MGVEGWFVTPSANAANGWQEGQSPSSVNDSARDILSSVRTWYNDAIWPEYGEGDGPYTAAGLTAEQFKIDGVDVTAAYHAGRRVKITGATTGTVYAYVRTSSYGGDTAVTVTARSGDIKLEALRIYLSAIPALNSALPRFWGGVEGEVPVQGDLQALGFIGGVGFYGYDSAGTIGRYARLRAAISDRNAGTTDGQLSMVVARNGVEVEALSATSDGVILGTPSGGQQGFGTLNCAGLFVNGVAAGTAPPDATTSIKGITRYATPTETQNRASVSAAVTPNAIPMGDTSIAGFVRLATQAEATAGSVTNRAVTPGTLEEAIAALMPDSPGQPDATTAVKGVVRLATDNEANAGTNTIRAVTPSNLPSAIAALAPTADTDTRGMVRTTTGVEFFSDTNTSTTITPSIGNWNAFSTISPIGHIVLPGGFQVAWGSVTESGNSFAFSRPFSTLYGFATGLGSTTSCFSNVSAFSETGLTLRKYLDTGSEVTSGGIFAIAWGAA